MTRVVPWWIAPVAVLALTLAGCGQDTTEQAADPASDPESSTSQTPQGDSDPSQTPTQEQSVPAGAGACSDVWVEDATIPRRYPGCVDDAGDFVERDALGCSSGQRLVRYDDRFYGVLGGTVHEVEAPLEKSKEYRASVRSCRA